MESRILLSEAGVLPEGGRHTSPALRIPTHRSLRAGALRSLKVDGWRRHRPSTARHPPPSPLPYPPTYPPTHRPRSPPPPTKRYPRYTGTCTTQIWPRYMVAESRAKVQVPSHRSATVPEELVASFTRLGCFIAGIHVLVAEQVVMRCARSMPSEKDGKQAN